MTNDQMMEIYEKGISDGARLYQLAGVFERILLAVVWVLGLCGVIGGFWIASAGWVFAGVAVVVGVSILCFISYLVVSISIGATKLLASILFANLAIMRRDGYESVQASAG